MCTHSEKSILCYLEKKIDEIVYLIEWKKERENSNELKII